MNIRFIDPPPDYSWTISLQNTTYKYRSDFVVNGSSLSLNLTFHEVVYNITIHQSGLPSGTIWYVNLSAATNLQPSYISNHSNNVVIHHNSMNSLEGDQ